MEKKTDIKQYIPVFVGSTYEDLKPYREAVKDTLVRLETIVRGMEFFGSKPGSPKDECLKVVNSCKVYIGVFAMRYGSTDPESGKSMTQLEYEEAQRLNLPSLIYLIDEENQPILAKHIDINDRAQKLAELKTMLKKKHMVSFFTTPESLARQISLDLPSVLKDAGAEVLQQEIGALFNAADFVRRFEARPKKYANQEFDALVSFKDLPRPAVDEDTSSLRLDCGDTLEIWGTFSKIPTHPTGYFYATGSVADWLENVDSTKEYSLRLRTLFGTGFEAEYTDQGTKSYDTAKYGYLIVSPLSAKGDGA